MTDCLQDRTICPHCWHSFEPHDVLWIATHPALRGDPRLGSDAFRRFLPSRFSSRGSAVDERGSECTRLACPNCHLHLPRALLEVRPWFVSIFGAPGSGKSYFLAAMAWVLRRRLPALFQLSFSDTDAEANQTIAGYEQALFHSANPDGLAPLGELIEKTREVGGDLYDSVLFGQAPIQFPRPFLFTIRPTSGGPEGNGDPAGPARILCLYDNAGESFLAGRDSSLSPVTRHLAQSELLLFLFDPTQHPPFRQRLAALGGEVPTDARPGQGVNRQDLILIEAADRVRRFARLRDTEKHNQPLIVLVSKQDAWAPLVPELRPTRSVVAKTRTGKPVLDVERIQHESRAIRRLLAETTPEIVSAAEEFARSVTYVGVSALGAPPVKDPETGRWAVRPAEIQPTGVELPILYGLHLQSPRFVPEGRRPQTARPGEATA